MAGEKAAPVLETSMGRFGHRTAAARDLHHFGHPSVAVEGDVAAGGERPCRPLAQRAPERLHRQIVRQEQPVEADMRPDHALHGTRRNRDAVLWIDGVEQEVAGHRPGKVRQQPEGHEIGPLQLGTRRRDPGERLVAVDRGPAMPGNMLDDRHHALGHQALGGGPAQRRDRFGPVGIGAVADHRMGLREGDVENGQTVDIAADRGHVRGQQTGIEPGRLEPGIGIAGIEVAQQPGRRRLAPLRRPQPGNPAAFLVDQDRRLAARHAGTQLVDQAARALDRVDVAGEQDEAQRIGIAEEGTLLRRQFRPGAAQNQRAWAAHRQILFPDEAESPCSPFKWGGGGEADGGVREKPSLVRPMTPSPRMTGHFPIRMGKGSIPNAVASIHILAGGRDRDAVGLAGLQRRADRMGLLLVERAGLHAVPDATVAEVDADSLHAQVRQLLAMRALQPRPGRLSDVLVLHRGDLDAPAAGRAGHVLDQAGDAGAAFGRGRRVGGRLHVRRIGRSLRLRDGGRGAGTAGGRGRLQRRRRLGRFRLPWRRGRQRQAVGRQFRRHRDRQQLLGLGGHGTGRDAVEDFLVLVGHHEAAGILGLDARRRGGRLYDQRLQSPAARLDVLIVGPPDDRAETRDGGDRNHHREDLAAATVDPHEQRVPGRRGDRIGFMRDGPRRRIEPHSYRLVGPVDRWSVAGGGPANMHFLSHFIDGCYAEDL